MEVLINATRVILAILIIGVLPGETLIYLLFGNSQLDVLERFYLTVLSSVAITSLIAFTLSRTEAGLTAQALVLGISLFVAFCLLAAWLRSQTLAGKSALAWRSPKKYVLRPFPREKLSKNFFSRPLAGVGNWLLLGTSLLVIISAVIGLSTTDQSLALTEFYITAEKLSRQGVEYSLVNDELVVPVGITNKEGQLVTYRVESWVAGEKVSTEHQIVVNDGEIWNGQVSVPSKAITSTNSVAIQLFREPEPQLIAELTIWLP